jgi:hypothetical protein
LDDCRGQRETARSHLNEIAPTLMMPGLWHGTRFCGGLGGQRGAMRSDKFPSRNLVP